MSYIRSNSN